MSLGYANKTVWIPHWYRKIASLGLTTEYKDRNSEIGTWLRMFFAHPVIGQAKNMEDTFCDVLMAEQPHDDRCETFSDYVLKYYIQVKYSDEQHFNTLSIQHTHTYHGPIIHPRFIIGLVH